MYYPAQVHPVLPCPRYTPGTPPYPAVPGSSGHGGRVCSGDSLGSEASESLGRETSSGFLEQSCLSSSRESVREEHVVREGTDERLDRTGSRDTKYSPELD